MTSPHQKFECPVAQSVERRTPCGESTRPGYERSGAEARRALDVYEPPGGYGYGWWQAVARRSQWGPGDRPCAAMCVCYTFDSKFCHRTGIAQSEGRGQGQRNMLCLAEALSS